jgi:hypothetical protein
LLSFFSGKAAPKASVQLSPSWATTPVERFNSSKRLLVLVTLKPVPLTYEPLTGEVPFRGDDHIVLRQALEEEPKRPRRMIAGIPRDPKKKWVNGASASPE